MALDCLQDKGKQQEGQEPKGRPASSLALGETRCPGARGGPRWFRDTLHLGDVLLADHMLSWLDLPGISGDEDASSLAATIRLADVSAGFSLMTIGLEVPKAT